MGRGRQKAKHTKVARDLKYFSPNTNYTALERELAGSTPISSSSDDAADWPEYVDPYADVVDNVEDIEEDLELDEDETRTA